MRRRSSSLSGKAWLLVLVTMAPATAPEAADAPLKDQVKELAFERDRALASLREALAATKQASETLRATLAEKEAVHQDLSRQEAAVRYLVEEVRRLTADLARSERHLAESREAERKAREKNAKVVMDLTSRAPDDALEMRQKLDALTLEKVKLATEHRDAKTRLEQLTRELETAKAEVARNRTQAQSSTKVQPGGQPAGSGDAALRARITELEASLRKSQVAQESLRKAAAAATTAGLSSQAPGEAAPGTDDPGVLATRFLEILKTRLRGALRGQFRGDDLDRAVAWVGGSVLAVVLLVAFLWWRVRRLRRKLRQLRMTVRPHSGGYSTAHAAAHSEPLHGRHPAPSRASPAAEAPEERLPRAGSFRSHLTREERSFSAVIAAPPQLQALEPEPQEPAVEEEPAQEPMEGEEPPTEEEPVPVPDEEEEESSASPSPGSRKGPSKSEPAADTELLDELKAALAKKFDDLIK